jgi:S-DNA-T family DNA segregation ATPase FtsK/SpoIIIE
MKAFRIADAGDHGRAKATNALRNAVLEMERRLKLLAAQGVRNIDQYNRKVRQMTSAPRSLFEEDLEPAELKEELAPLPYILIIIDELADLMMLERHNVEESVTRLAQMARAWACIWCSRRSVRAWT